MDIGGEVRKQPDANPYIHDFLLSMALAKVMYLCPFLIVGGCSMANHVCEKQNIVIFYG
jgi:hypothetical protein